MSIPSDFGKVLPQGHIVDSCSTCCLPGVPGPFLLSCFPAGCPQHVFFSPHMHNFACTPIELIVSVLFCSCAQGAPQRSLGIESLPHITEPTVGNRAAPTASP
uniref:Uncharacterized protein n=1 Tax=Phasianus colchicus TaxID=9054 RepID=A0A669QPW0_PHACC